MRGAEDHFACSGRRRFFLHGMEKCPRDSVAPVGGLDKEIVQDPRGSESQRIPSMVAEHKPGQNGAVKGSQRGRMGRSEPFVEEYLFRGGLARDAVEVQVCAEKGR